MIRCSLHVAGHSGCCVENGWERIKVGASTTLQAGADGSLDEGVGCRSGNTGPDAGYILRLEPQGLADGNPLALPFLWLH